MIKVMLETTSYGWDVQVFRIQGLKSVCLIQEYTSAFNGDTATDAIIRAIRNARPYVDNDVPEKPEHS